MAKYTIPGTVPVAQARTPGQPANTVGIKDTSKRFHHLYLSPLLFFFNRLSLGGPGLTRPLGANPIFRFMVLAFALFGISTPYLMGRGFFRSPGRV